MKFSKNLKQYLASNNLSLKELARRLDVPQSTVHGWVNGIPPKNILTLKKIAEVFGCSIDELCFGPQLNDIKTTNVRVLIDDQEFELVLKRL